MDPSTPGFGEIPPPPYTIYPGPPPAAPTPTPAQPAATPATEPPAPATAQPAATTTAAAAPPVKPPRRLRLPIRRSRTPRRRERVSVVASAALVVALLLGGGRWALIHSGATGSPGATDCPGGAARLSVVADPAIAPAVAAVANRFQRDHKCAALTVAARPSMETAGRLAGGGAPDVWIPESSLWFDVVRDAAQRQDLAKRAVSVAASPLVFAVPNQRSVAADLQRRSWNALRQGRTPRPYALRLLDPADSATGMASLLVLQRLSGNSRPRLTAMLRANLATATTGDPRQLVATGRPPTPLLVTTEQAAWRQLRAEKGSVAAVYPSWTAALDFPFVTVHAGNATVQRSAKDFLAALQSPAGLAELHRVGLRTADNAADRELNSVGLPAASPRILRLARPGAARGIRQTWQRSHRKSRVIALIDTSDTMGRPLPGAAGTTRMQAAAQALDEALAAMPGEAEVALWATTQGRPFRPLASLGPLTDRRAILHRELTALRPGPRGADTGLYDAIGAAYRELAGKYQPGKVDYVLVLTDGTASAARLRPLVSELQQDFDPRQPVHIVSLGIGQDADPAALRQIADASNGAAYLPKTPELIKDLIIRSTAPRT